jgi:branched-subunit amino acid transport protein
MNIWLLMLIAGLLTFLTRLSFIWLFDRITVPALLRRALYLVPPAVLSVIIFQELFIQEGRLAIGFGNFRLLAGLIAVVAAWRTKNALITIAAGMASLWIMTAVFS